MVLFPVVSKGLEHIILPGLDIAAIREHGCCWQLPAVHLLPRCHRFFSTGGNNFFGFSTTAVLDCIKLYFHWYRYYTFTYSSHNFLFIRKRIVPVSFGLAAWKLQQLSTLLNKVYTIELPRIVTIYLSTGNRDYFRFVITVSMLW